MPAPLPLVLWTFNYFLYLMMLIETPHYKVHLRWLSCQRSEMILMCLSLTTLVYLYVCVRINTFESWIFSKQSSFFLLIMWQLPLNVAVFLSMWLFYLNLTAFLNLATFTQSGCFPHYLAIIEGFHCTGILEFLNYPTFCRYPTTIAMIASGKLNAKPLITHHFPLEKSLEAFQTAHTGAGGAIKVIIDCFKK